MLEILIFLEIIIMGIVCAIIANGKGRNPTGWFFVGLLLNLIGLIMIAVLPRAGKKCPKCAETVLQEAQKCRFCGYEFPASISNPPATSTKTLDQIPLKYLIAALVIIIIAKFIKYYLSK
ncbi:MAG: zinc ribbon domain-containing protein [Deltaproteobacteria bacterium]|nr:zinc ribbon domain-containing protein [Deltaproteobacteria bacterium]